MKTFNVQVARTTTRAIRIEVQAETKEGATFLALDAAGNYDFFEASESNPHYEVWDVNEVTSTVDEEVNPFRLD